MLCSFHCLRHSKTFLSTAALHSIASAEFYLFFCCKNGFTLLYLRAARTSSTVRNFPLRAGTTKFCHQSKIIFNTQPSSRRELQGTRQFQRRVTHTIFTFIDMARTGRMVKKQQTDKFAIISYTVHVFMCTWLSDFYVMSILCVVSIKLYVGINNDFY
jgi:hypothetical protein